MTVTIHNPDQYMASLRQIIAQGRKRVGLLVGAGGPAGVASPTDPARPLIPAVAELTTQVLAALDPKYTATIAGIKAEIPSADIESILSRVRSLAKIIGTAVVHGFNGAGHEALGKAICTEIGKIANQPLPAGPNPFSDLVNWIGGTGREHAVEVFTTNYDMLFELALEKAKAPFFDGFSGAKEPFFDPSSVASDELPPRWTRLWKLHGSLGWKANTQGEVIRTGETSDTHLVFPEHLKYEQTQKAPYSALFDRLRSFLMTPDTLLVSIGFSFADAHIASRIDECLAANPSTSVFAFQFKTLAEEQFACDIASRRSNMSVYGRDRAMINGVAAAWQPGDLPSRDWGPIRATYWDSPNGTTPSCFVLGRFDRFARFFAASRADQVFPAAPVVPAATPAPSTP